MSIQRQLTNERMSQIVVHSGTVYLAGQVGDDMSAGIEQQTRETLGNIERLLDLAGTDKSRLLSYGGVEPPIKKPASTGAAYSNESIRS